MKEWFAETTFAQLDRSLREAGNDRSAIVSSDIALHVPGLARPLFFHGETRGAVAETAPSFPQSAQYPWLTPFTFNGWLVPEGATKRLGEMSLEESWFYDFRIKALTSLVDRLEEFTAVLNMPRSAYSKRRLAVPSGQLLLVPHGRPLILVIGKTCSGKSTFGNRCETGFGYQWFEASDIVRSMMAADEVGGSAESVSAFAKRLLHSDGFDVVARKVATFLDSDPDRPSVVTGFRTLEELEFFKARYPACVVVLLESSERTRFERYLQRARPGSVTRLKEFSARDRSQWDFGLLAVGEDFADIRITNEGALEDFFGQIDSVLSGKEELYAPGVSVNIHSSRKSEASQLVRCLKALVTFSGPVDCNQISDRTDELGGRIRFNNVNKILKRYPQLVLRVDDVGEKVLYQILDPGRTYLRLSAS